MFAQIPRRKEMNEPEIVINNQKLSKAEAMTIRVAVASFQVTLQEGLGDDEAGKSICEGYKNCINLINRKIFGVI